MPQWIPEAPQGSEIWLKHKVGVLSGSRIAAIFDQTKAGKPGSSYTKLLWELATERISNRMTDVYVNAAMLHGKKYEDEARDIYEQVSGRLVGRCDMAMHDTIEWLGCSPDGLIDDDTVLEIKCPGMTNHLKWRLAGELPPEYWPQVMLEMLVTCRNKAVFVSYHPFLPEGINLFIKEYTPTPAELDGVREAAERFLAEVAELQERLMN